MDHALQAHSPAGTLVANWEAGLPSTGRAGSQPNCNTLPAKISHCLSVSACLSLTCLAVQSCESARILDHTQLVSCSGMRNAESSEGGMLDSFKPSSFKCLCVCAPMRFAQKQRAWRFVPYRNKEVANGSSSMTLGSSAELGFLLYKLSLKH